MSRYGTIGYGSDAMRPCPAGMYPWDIDFEADEVCTDFEVFKGQAERSADVLNLPISWVFEDEKEVFSLVFVMPRKYGKTWEMALTYHVEQRDEIEEWLEQWTKKVAAAHYGWTEEVR